MVILERALIETYKGKEKGVCKLDLYHQDRSAATDALACYWHVDNMYKKASFDQFPIVEGF